MKTSQKRSLLLLLVLGFTLLSNATPTNNVATHLFKKNPDKTEQEKQTKNTGSFKEPVIKNSRKIATTILGVLGLIGLYYYYVAHNRADNDGYNDGYEEPLIEPDNDADDDNPGNRARNRAQRAQQENAEIPEWQNQLNAYAREVRERIEAMRIRHAQEAQERAQEIAAMEARRQERANAQAIVSAADQVMREIIDAAHAESHAIFEGIDRCLPDHDGSFQARMEALNAITEEELKEVQAESARATAINANALRQVAEIRAQERQEIKDAREAIARLDREEERHRAARDDRENRRRAAQQEQENRDRDARQNRYNRYRAQAQRASSAPRQEAARPRAAQQPLPWMARLFPNGEVAQEIRRQERLDRQRAQMAERRAQMEVEHEAIRQQMQERDAALAQERIDIDRRNAERAREQEAIDARFRAQAAAREQEIIKLEEERKRSMDRINAQIEALDRTLAAKRALEAKIAARADVR